MNEGRKEIIQILVVMISLVMIVKLFLIQVANNRYAELADSNSVMKEVEYPFRGLIYDRNGKLLVYNTPQYDVMLIRREMHHFDSAAFCAAFKLSREELRRLFQEMVLRKEYSREKPTLFLEKLSNTDFARVQDRLDEFPGFYIQARTTRAYTWPSLANALGYVSEISKDRLANDAGSNYKQGDYIGQSGIEAFYENQLRGKRGVRHLYRDVKGLIKGSFKGGAYDTLSVPGENLTTGIDIELQQYGELLLNHKAGSIVAIEPSTGEILALVSGPSYDPNLLTGKYYSTNYKLVSSDTNKPLFNRPLMAQYRPGSIFKIAQAMTALQEGVITPETRIRCDRSIINCHGPHTNEDLRGAITNSCNPYFHGVFRRMINRGQSEDPFKDSRLGLADWNKHIRSFGFGSPLGIDLPNEKGGLVPSPEDYDRWYTNRPWKFSNIYSLAIGEGENLVAPIQMANFAATVANRGFYYTPHLVKSVGKDGKPLPQYLERHYTTIDSTYFKVAVDAMQNVVQAGTAVRAYLPDIVVCGKTGSVENDPRPEHSVFIAFAPRDNPKIAISVYVEYAGMGGRAAASIAGLMIEKYLKGSVNRKYIEDYVLAGQFVDAR
ncbi:MAG: penicillin-binding transpeptidase domain-containing protein [Cyclobacteriaceae bacterium]